MTAGKQKGAFFKIQKLEYNKCRAKMCCALLMARSTRLSGLTTYLRDRSMADNAAGFPVHLRFQKSWSPLRAVIGLQQSAMRRQIIYARRSCLKRMS